MQDVTKKKFKFLNIPDLSNFHSVEISNIKVRYVAIKLRILRLKKKWCTVILAGGNFQVVFFFLNLEKSCVFWMKQILNCGSGFPDVNGPDVNGKWINSFHHVRMVFLLTNKSWFRNFIYESWDYKQCWVNSPVEWYRVIDLE